MAKDDNPLPTNDSVTISFSEWELTVLHLLLDREIHDVDGCAVYAGLSEDTNRLRITKDKIKKSIFE